MFADHQIRFEVENSGEISVSPYNPSLVQPASIELRLGQEFMRCIQGDEPIDPENPNSSDWVSFEADKFVIRPGDFVLATTMEWIRVGSNIGARVEGKSTLGRLGLIIHSTAGFVDPGFSGNITLEMTNINSRPIVLRYGMKICQMAFYRMDAEVELPYGHVSLGSHYHGQVGVTPPAVLRSNSIP